MAAEGCSHLCPWAVSVRKNIPTFFIVWSVISGWWCSTQIDRHARTRTHTSVGLTTLVITALLNSQPHPGAALTWFTDCAYTSLSLCLVPGQWVVTPLERLVHISEHSVRNVAVSLRFNEADLLRWHNCISVEQQNISNVIGELMKSFC